MECEVIHFNVPISGEGSPSCEYKCSDGSANPYIALAAVITAGMIGKQSFNSAFFPRVEKKHCPVILQVGNPVGQRLISLDCIVFDMDYLYHP